MKKFSDITDLIANILSMPPMEEHPLFESNEPKKLPFEPPIPLHLLSKEEGEPFIWWNGYQLPFRNIGSHFVTIGSIGSGKTVLTNNSIKSVLDVIEKGETNTKAVVIETKGGTLQMLEAMKIPYLYFNISDKRSSDWDTEKDCSDVQEAGEMAKNLNPPKQHSSDSFWGDSVDVTIASVVEALTYLKIMTGRKWSFHEVYQICMSDLATLIKILKLFPTCSDVVTKLLDGTSEKTLSIVMMQLLVELRPLKMAAAHSKNTKHKFSITEFLKDDSTLPKVLVLSWDVNANRYSMPIIQAMFETMTNKINSMTDDDHRKIFIFLDEARFIGKLRKLPDLAVYGRSKGARLWLTIQTIEGFWSIYSKDVANEILGVCGYKTLLKAASPDTAKWMCSLAGEIEFFETVVNPNFGQGGVSFSHQKQRVRRLAVLDSEFLKLSPPDEKVGITGFFLSPFARGNKETIPTEEIERAKPRYADVPDLVPKDPLDKILPLWTLEEAESFYQSLVENLKNGKQKSVASPQENFRGMIFDQLEPTLRKIIKELARRIKNEKN